VGSADVSSAGAKADPPKVLDRWIRFHLLDPDHLYTSVTLACDNAVPTPRRALRRKEGQWVLRIPRPPLGRLEYQLVVEYASGDRSWITDPANPNVVETAFGPKSAVELPGYRPPAWLAAEAIAGASTRFEITGETADAVPITVWAPADSVPGESMPLLLVHDGPEYDNLASLTRYCAAQIAADLLPRHRVALIHPVQRDAWYSGSPQYLRTEVGAGLSHLRASYAVSEPVAVMGASLGGLTSLLAGLLGAPHVGAVFSQSGSFFQVGHDQDIVSGFPYFGRISRQVRAILDTRHSDHPLRVGMTCGVLEENAPNNRDMASALARAGHKVDYLEVPDLHNYTAWRDCLDPMLTDILRDCWGAQG